MLVPRSTRASDAAKPKCIIQTWSEVLHEKRSLSHAPHRGGQALANCRSPRQFAASPRAPCLALLSAPHVVFPLLLDHTMLLDLLCAHGAVWSGYLSC